MKQSEEKSSALKSKKTSQQWYDLLGTHYMILNPDGWDRKNYDYSFNQELITEAEYTRRLSLSTILHESQFGTFVPQ